MMKAKAVAQRFPGARSKRRFAHVPAVPSAAPRPQIRSILVPIDFSEPANEAFTYACRLAKQFGARIVLLHVIEPVLTPDFAYSPLLMENDKVLAQAKVQLDRVIGSSKLNRELIEKTLVRNGTAFHEITQTAKSLKIDLIVISTHGYTGLRHILLGSTTERVVRHAPCPVLVVRHT